ncbi:MAG: hypothetical protein WDM77_19290 [Steroidobacteraceae bacterium]
MAVGSIGASNLGLIAADLPRAKSADWKAAKNSAGNVSSAQSTQSTAASLEGQIRIAREQLNDWVTCVSATTPKGQAEIRSLTAQISAAQERINQLRPAASATTADTAGSVSTRLDVWA